jgi:hypothetical protein
MFLQCLRCLGLLLITLMVSACQQHHKNNSKFAPKVNPKQLYQIQITGYARKKLLKTARPKFILSYQTMAKKCQKNINMLEGVWVPRTVLSKIAPRENTGNKFVLAIPLDKYAPGSCRWQPGELYMKLGNRHYDIAFFSPNSVLKVSSNGSVDIVCHQNSRCSVANVTGFAAILTKPLPMNQTYNLKINFEEAI